MAGGGAVDAAAGVDAAVAGGLAWLSPGAWSPVGDQGTCPAPAGAAGSGAGPAVTAPVVPAPP